MLNRIGYDPNDVRDLKRDMVIEVTFSQWEYHKTVTVTVKGNVSMIEYVDSALEHIYNNLPTHDYFGGEKLRELRLVSDEGEELQCLDGDDDDPKYEEWLRPMVSCMKFVKFVDVEVKQ